MEGISKGTTEGFYKCTAKNRHGAEASAQTRIKVIGNNINFSIQENLKANRKQLIQFSILDSYIFINRYYDYILPNQFRFKSCLEFKLEYIRKKRKLRTCRLSLE